MERHIFLIPGFFGFANIGDFAYWGPIVRKLDGLLREAGMPAELHCVKSLPTSSLRARGRCLLETVAGAGLGSDAIVHLIGHSTGGLDARLLLTPAVYSFASYHFVAACRGTPLVDMG
jgi:triacylglycerol esterase/lipase EstA (alpha/beta hydrolase family)